VESPLFVEKQHAPGFDTSARHKGASGRSSVIGRSNASTRLVLSCEIDHSENRPEPMDLDPLEPAQDGEVFDQRSPSGGDHSTPRWSLSDSVLEMVPSRCSPGADPELGDSKSECTQISLETVSLEWDQGERATGEEPSPDTGSALGTTAQTPIDPAAQRRSSSETIILSEERRPSRSEELEAFLGGLRRAQVEQEELEKRMESDRLNEELNLLYHNQASPRDLLQSGHTQNSSLPEGELGVAAVSCGDSWCRRCPCGDSWFRRCPCGSPFVSQRPPAEGACGSSILMRSSDTTKRMISTKE
jgi:hypothetical protein